MSNYWFTSDLHLGHQNVIKYCNRPYDSVDEMNEDIIRRINSLVGNDDDLYIVGDVCMGKIHETLELIKQINGLKILIVGNHDRPWGEFDDDLRLIESEPHPWYDRYREAGFVNISGHLSFPLTSRSILTEVCHLPYRGEVEAERHDDKHDARKLEDEGNWLVHGHTHGLWRQRGRMIDVGIDAWGGWPVSFAQVEYLIDNGENNREPIPWVR